MTSHLPAGDVVLPRAVVEEMLFEMAAMTLDKRQATVWNKVATAIDFDGTARVT